MPEREHRASASRQAKRRPAAEALLLLTLAWGALSFGAVYPWAYWPLAGACLLCGIAGLLAEGVRREHLVNGSLLAALALFGAAVLVQLVPLPVSVLAGITPRTVEVLREHDLSFFGGVKRHAASLDPKATAAALALYGSFAVMLLGTAALASRWGARRILEGIAILGTALAVIGIVQKPLYSGAIYGFWKPMYRGSPFGPFVNENHFAGWMLMALPLTLALVFARGNRAMRGIRPGWRDTILWFSAPDAGQLILLAFAAGVMALSLVLTGSRSGISALALAVVLFGGFIVRGISPGSRRRVAGAYVLLLVLTTVAWAGAETIASEFSATDWSEFNNRRGAWIDGWSVFTMFPIAGTGLNTYGTSMLLFQRHQLHELYVEAHNDYLQLAAEGGLLLVVPACLLAGAFIVNVRRRLREDPERSTEWWLRRGAVVALVAIALQEVVDFSLQIPGNAALFAVVCGIALHRGRAA